MRLVILIGLILALGVVALIGFLRLARELLIGDFFHAPSMPGETANQPEETRPETSPHSTTPIA